MVEGYDSQAQTGQRRQLIPFLADQHLPYLVPAILFWMISLTFHYIDTHGLLSKYKLHTPAEDLTKNRASRWDVIKFALIQQAAQCTLGYFTAGEEPFIPHDQAIAVWARSVQRAKFQSIHLLGVSNALSYVAPMTAGSFVSNDLDRPGNASSIPPVNGPLAFAGLGSERQQPNEFDMAMGTVAYWVLVPLCQYITAMVLADTMQYFTHRAFHVNKWLYKHVHSMHHDIYVPFAYGAFYNHPLETIPIDGILFPLCLTIARLDNRQAAFFGAIWTFKTVVDHCGYDFPYNPCNIVCPNSVLYHDLHHQTWGMKFNFSVYAALWDKLMGTYWSPHDGKAQEKYIRSKTNAEVSLAKRESRQSSQGESSAVEFGPKRIQAKT